MHEGKGRRPTKNRGPVAHSLLWEVGVALTLVRVSESAGLSSAPDSATKVAGTQNVETESVSPRADRHKKLVLGGPPLWFYSKYSSKRFIGGPPFMVGRGVL